MKTEWILYPVCGNKTHDRKREDTVLKNYPLYCPKCKLETLIEFERYLLEIQQVLGGNESSLCYFTCIGFV